MQTMDPVKAIKMLKGALTNIQKMKIEEQKKAVRSGYDMDILPTDIITYEKDTLELLDDLFPVRHNHVVGKCVQTVINRRGRHEKLLCAERH